MQKQHRAVKHDINFFSVLKKQEKSGASDGRRRPLFLVGAMALLLVAACGVYGLLLSEQISSLRTQVSRTEDFVISPDNQEAYQATQALLASQEDLAHYNDLSKQYTEALQNQPRLTAESFRKVQQRLPENVSVERFTFDRNQLEIACVSPDKDAPARFAENLTSAGDFDAVDYYGFQYRKQTIGGVYTFKVRCLLWSPLSEGVEAP